MIPGSTRVDLMSELMDGADGSRSLRAGNAELFEGALPSEVAAMTASVLGRCARLLGDVATGSEAPAAFGRVANLQDGMPGCDGIVAHFRGLAAAPDEMDEREWIWLTRDAEGTWGGDARELMETARRLGEAEARMR